MRKDKQEDGDKQEPPGVPPPLSGRRSSQTITHPDARYEKRKPRHTTIGAKGLPAPNDKVSGGGEKERR